MIACTITSGYAGTRFEVVDNLVFMDNEITSRSFDQFVQLHKDHPQINTIVMREIDGSSDDDVMIKLGYYLRKHRFRTHLEENSEIYSGGVDLFLAGVQRTMERGAIVGVHSWSDGEKDASEYPRSSPEHELNRKYINDMLGRDTFYWFTIYAAPANEIYEMTDAEITQFGLLTKPIID